MAVNGSEEEKVTSSWFRSPMHASGFFAHRRKQTPQDVQAPKQMPLLALDVPQEAESQDPLRILHGNNGLLATGRLQGPVPK